MAKTMQYMELVMVVLDLYARLRSKLNFGASLKAFLYKPGDIERESAPKQRFTEKLAAI